MATSSTLKTLKQEDGPISPSGQPVAARPNDLTGRLETWRQSIWRRRWLSLTTAWLLCVAGWAVIALWPTSYSASAVIYADLVDRVGDQNAADGPEPTSLEMLEGILLADESLDVVRAAVSLDSMKSRSLREDLVIRPTVPAVFVLAYEHENPVTAQKTLDVLIKGFQTRLNASTSASSEAVTVLDRQIDDGERRLATVRADLEAFKRVNADHLSKNGNESAELALLQRQFDDLEDRSRTAIEKRDDVAADLAQLPQSRDDAAATEPRRSPEEIETERNALESELAKLQERYADTHPYVVAVFEAIDALDTEIAAQPGDGVDESALIAADGDALEQRHGELILEVTTLNSQLENKRREIELLQALTRTTTSVEAELSGFEAEEDQLLADLDGLRQRRNELGGVIGGEANEDAVRLIKEPELPTDPVGPSRLMALAAVLVGGTGLGAAAAVFFNRCKGVFESAWQLKQRFDVGVLGTISEVMTPTERRKFRHARLAFSLACLALVGIFSGLAFAELTDRLAPWGERLRTQFLG